MDNENTTSQRQKIIKKGNYGSFHKPLAQHIGLEAAIVLDFLIYKYDNFVDIEKEYINIGGYKAFYITYSDIEEATTIKKQKLGRNRDSNPLKILEDVGLIKRNTSQININKRRTYYILYFDRIIMAMDKALDSQLKKRKEKSKKKEIENNITIDNDPSNFNNFINNMTQITSDDSKPIDSSKLQNGSPVDVGLAVQELPDVHITNNKITNNRKKNMKKKKDLTTNNKPEQASSVANDLKIAEEELIETFPDLKEDIKETMKHAIAKSIMSMVEKSKYKDLDDDADEIISELTVNLRNAVITPFEFFLRFKNYLLKDKFKNFDFSEEDDILINNLIIQNPLFEDEYPSYDDRKTDVKRLREENPGITNDEITYELERDQFSFEDQYDIINEKIYENYYRIIIGDRKARFGNLFVGIKERSENYALHMDSY